MTKTHTSRQVITMQAIIFSCIAAMTFITSATAATVNYSLDNVIQDNNQQMTGVFQWTYDDGNFENGTGLFTDLFIPGHGTDIDALSINFDITKSIEFSLIANVHSGGVNVTLFLLEALTPTTSASIDTARSSYEIERGGSRGGFVSGSITPEIVPIPPTVWLFTSGLLCLLSIVRHNRE